MMPRQTGPTRILIFDDALEPLRVDGEALGTEMGYAQQLRYDQEFSANLCKLAKLGVTAIFTDRAICDRAEEILNDLAIIGVQRVARHEWRRLAELAGACPLKRSALSKPEPELLKLSGFVAGIQVDERLKNLQILAPQEHPFVTILVGANTKEVVAERERIAKDAAAAVQAAVQGGVVPGGGSVELGLARQLCQNQLPGMASYGYNCVIEALKRPLTQICVNSGFNPLEKVEAVWAQQAIQDSCAIGVNCDNGALADMTELGIWDPYFVKQHAIQSAGEVSQAILRINTIIKMKVETEEISGVRH
jgi:chaperonin GroEL (HSP60 family)